jgi:N-acetylglutamate synthase-like GNAT family acetyltransferase
MRALPAWFGIEEAIQNYAKDLESCDGFVALEDRDVVGFVGLKRYGSDAIELNVIGVLPQRRRKGIGSELLRAVEEEARDSGVRFLHTKTLSASKPNEAYEQSRAFWRAAGFLPFDEHLLWGPSSPCLVLLKALR